MPSYVQLRRRFRKIYEDYKPRFVYWKLVLLARKLCLACIVVLFDRRIEFQVCFEAQQTPRCPRVSTCDIAGHEGMWVCGCVGV